MSDPDREPVYSKSFIDMTSKSCAEVIAFLLGYDHTSGLALMSERKLG